MELIESISWACHFYFLVDLITVIYNKVNTDQMTNNKMPELNRSKQNEDWIFKTKQTTDVLNTNHNDHTKQCESERSNKRILKLEPVVNTNKLCVRPCVRSWYGSVVCPVACLVYQWALEMFFYGRTENICIW